MKSLLYLNGLLLILVCLGLLLLPKSFTAALTHAPWFRDLVGIFDADTRSLVDSNSYPWSAIGMVHDDWREVQCTGFLVSPTRVVTSAHCVLDEEGRIRTRTYYSILRQTHYGTLDYPANGLRLAFPEEDLVNLAPGHDLAWFDVLPGIGEQVGYLGVAFGGVTRPGRAGSMAGPEPSAELGTCRETFDELPWLEARGGPETSLRWLAPDLNAPPEICVAGFSGDIGFDRLSVAGDCGVLAVTGSIVLHTCTIEDGASGGPLFYLDRQGRPVVFAINRSAVSDPTVEEIFGVETIYVGALLPAHLGEAP